MGAIGSEYGVIGRSNQKKIEKSEKKNFFFFWSRKICFWHRNARLFIKMGNKPHKWTDLVESVWLVPFCGTPQKIFRALRKFFEEHHKRVPIERSPRDLFIYEVYCPFWWIVWHFGAKNIFFLIKKYFFFTFFNFFWLDLPITPYSLPMAPICLPDTN